MLLARNDHLPVRANPAGRPGSTGCPARHGRAVRGDTDGVVSPHPTRHLLRAKDLADGRYFEPLDVAALARAAGLSRAHFSREFRRAFGESPHRYLVTRRMERAAALLRDTDRTVANICLLVGMGSVGSFTTTFRRTFGMPPLAYRAAYPPAARLARIPDCLLRAWGRPGYSTFGEDAGSPSA